METVVTVLMILIALSFILKQSFGKPYTVIAAAVVLALFAGFAWPLAIEQSKSRISEWLADSSLMLDVAVVLSVEIFLQMSFCIMAADISSEGTLPKWKILIYKALRWFPGILVFPVIFSALVYAVFALPGYDFRLISWSLAGVVLVSVACGAWLFRKIIPEKDLRLELLFIFNALTAIFGVIATVNGQTAVEGISEVDWSAFAGIAGITLAGAAVGLACYFVRLRIPRRPRHSIRT